MNIFKEFEDELKPNEKYRVAFVRKAVQDYYLFFFKNVIFLIISVSLVFEIYVVKPYLN